MLLTEMDVMSVSIRMVKDITERLMDARSLSSRSAGLLHNLMG
jgi:hypothetical protein